MCCVLSDAARIVVPSPNLVAYELEGLGQEEVALGL